MPIPFIAAVIDYPRPGVVLSTGDTVLLDEFPGEFRSPVFFEQIRADVLNSTESRHDRLLAELMDADYDRIQEGILSHQHKRLAAASSATVVDET